jgi:acyl-CoA thioester hydrolase
MSSTPPRTMPFRSVQHVYFDDLDALEILHNVRYLLFMERARGELFNALGFRWEDDVSINPDKFHVVAAHAVTYLRPWRGEGDVVVELWPTHLGRSSFALRAHVSSIALPAGTREDGALTAGREQIVYAEATTRLVRLDPVTRTPCPWSERFRNAVGPLIGEAPAAGNAR